MRYLHKRKEARRIPHPVKNRVFPAPISMAWKELEPASGRGQEATINLSAAGKLTWSKAIATAMGEVTHIALLHDAERQRLGIRAATDGKGIPVQKGGHSAAVKSTLAAAKVWDLLELPIAGRPALLEQESGVWAISVKPSLAPLKRRRRQAEEAGGEPNDEYPVQGTVRGLGRTLTDE